MSKLYEDNWVDGLQQGEILRDVRQYNPVTIDDKLKIETIEYPLAIVMSQDCDLEQDYTQRRSPNPEKQHRILANVLLCRIRLLKDFFPEFCRINSLSSKPDKALSSTAWNYLTSNRDDRYHILYENPKHSLNHMAIIFNEYFTVPTNTLYREISENKTERVCFLTSPYKEHLSTRFHYFHFRVALPENYVIEFKP